MTWLVIGDLNIIFNSEEKLGGLPFNREKVEPILNLIQRTGLEDLGFSGNIFTWSNKREGTANIKQRLDMAMANAEWNIEFHDASLQHLVAIGYDYGLISLSINFNQVKLSPTFKFYDTWLKEESCLQVIQNSSRQEITNNPDMDLLNNIQALGDNLGILKRDIF
ncbi:uncharacterized protein LOC113296575 [Papaver somniferum]|uniref:uncharacterized protein LOC113296575 n=1 Tax=Papaver somniferum TaxID=3469 RepID=UPI000E7032DA|nr:uncharacterized protein LOC113296575 [Papaver somniferum]